MEPQREILVTTYNPHDNTLPNLVKKNWGILGKCTNTRPIHGHRLLTAYRRPQNLRDLLVRSDCQAKRPRNPAPNRDLEARNKFLQGPLQPSTSKMTSQTSILRFFKRGNQLSNPIISSSSTSDLTTNGSHSVSRSASLGTFKPTSLKGSCNNKKCRYCPKLDKSGTIKCHVTGVKHSCKYNINCKTSNVIYAITCRTCCQQYVGQTKRTLANRFQGHFYNTINAIEYRRASVEGVPSTKLEPKDGVSQHFSAPDHNGIQDMTIQVLEFIRLPPQSGKALQLRLKLEKAWIHRLRCPAPTGMNIFD